MSLDVTDAALEVLTDLGYSPEYGARPLKRVVRRRSGGRITSRPNQPNRSRSPSPRPSPNPNLTLALTQVQREVESPLARGLIRGDFLEGVARPEADAHVHARARTHTSTYCLDRHTVSKVWRGRKLLHTCMRMHRYA